jgi:DNA mismatch endonuclease (patch repair protein)
VTDVHSPDIRAKNMRAIRSKDTVPELLVRRALHASGLRYSLHRKNLPGTPDLVFRQYRSVVFIHGCFWHGHSGCRYFRLPQSRPDFWREKISRNTTNDAAAIAALVRSGWRVAVVWECALKQKKPEEIENLVGRLSEWIAVEKDDRPVEFSAVGTPSLISL